MLFNKTKYRAKIEALEADLSHFHKVEQDLQKEMVYFSLDKNGNFIEVSELFSQLLGYSLQDLLNKNIKDIILTSSLEKEHTVLMLNAIKSSSHWHGALPLRRKDNSEAWLRGVIQPSYKDNKKQHQLLIYATELTRTIKKSRSEQDMLAALNRSSAMIEFSLNGIILDANTNFLNAVQYKKSDIVGQHHRIFCDPAEINSPEYKSFWHTLAAGEYILDRFKRIDSSGNIIWLEASYNPVHDDSGELYKVVKFATVITEQMNREHAISETSEVAYDISNKTDKNAANGIDVIKNTIDTMHALSNQMDSASKGIYELDEQSSKVAALVDSIRGIAEQTNLLALNAAIEAARAGEQGRGFAVVADEVRQLASRTSTATKQIIDVVSENKQLTSDAVALIEKSQLQANKALQLSNEAGQVMSEIRSGAQQVVDAVSNFNKHL